MTTDELLRKIIEAEQKVLAFHNQAFNTLKEEVINATKQAPEENLEPKFDVPYVGQKYWFIYDDGEVYESKWEGDNFDTARLAQENLFLTKQQALKELQYRKLRAKYVAYVKEYNGDWVADLDNHEQEKSHLYYNAKHNTLVLTSSYRSVMTDLAFVFKDKDFLPFIQKRMTVAEIRAVINHDLSMIEVGNE